MRSESWQLHWHREACLDRQLSTLLVRHPALEQGGKDGRKLFQYYLDARGITQAKQAKALLLHSAGIDVQDIFESLTDPGHPENTDPDPHNVYEIALRTLDAYFLPSTNEPYERSIFHRMRTAQKLGVLKLGHRAATVNALNAEPPNAEPPEVQKFPHCFQGLGKLKDHKVKSTLMRPYHLWLRVQEESHSVCGENLKRN